MEALDIVMQRFEQGAERASVQYGMRKWRPLVRAALIAASKGDYAELHKLMAAAYGPDPDDDGLTIKAILEELQ